MYSKLSVLLKELIDEEYHTARDLAVKLNVSEKTVRVRLKELNDIVVLYSAMITSKSNMGYKLIIDNYDHFNQLVHPDNNVKSVARPTTSNERVIFILDLLLSLQDYIKLDDLCEKCHVSRNTMTADLKKVEYILRIHHLILERRPNYGIIINGSELNKRICLVNNLIKRSEFINVDESKDDKLKTIGNIILSVLHKTELRISEISLENLVSHIYVALHRSKNGCSADIDGNRIAQLVKPDVIQVTKEIALRIQDELKTFVSDNEQSYIALHMGAKLSSGSYNNPGANIVISRKIDQLTWRMLEIVRKSFNINFMDNLELRMSLNQHMVPLDIRMQYGIPLANPLLDEIKKEYAFAYTMAATACIALSEHYVTNIPEDEIAYFAILFELAMDKKDKKIDKKNIIVVCSSGKGTTQLFIHKYKQAFGRYIENIYECTAWELDTFDFSANSIDYIFTTIPINSDVPVPVFEVNLFLENKDIVTCNEIFESGSNDFLDRYYLPELFVTDIVAQNKEDALKILCSHTEKFYPLPEGFYDAVMKREVLGQTDFGNLIAIPHPFQVMTRKSFVTVGILRQPVWWGNNEVQVIFLISISSEEDSEIGRFYQLTTKLLFDGEALQQLLNDQRFEVLMSLLKDNVGGKTYQI
ncbi:MAG: PRD domain-containing protein [Enterobacteriaceae bacterium]|nr:PRD domain-containing protein [Enterobacteriaceae bacterium]MDU7376964.1 PRD domain-containing protein [Enterobacteriaceae bacterium]